MIRLLHILVLSLFLIQSSWAQDTHWKERFSLVTKDINQIEGLKKKDLALTLRLFELYSEKLNLLLEAENFRLLKNTSNQNISDQLQNMIKTTHIKINQLSNIIEKRTTDRGIISKIYFFKGLNDYSVKNYSSFHTNFKKAESYCSEENICYKIKNKLADYYYNENNYKEAIRYYSAIVKNESDPWLSKNYFNLAWSYLKIEQYDDAITNLLLAKKYSDDPKYFTIGKQLDKSILIFYAHAKKTQECLALLRRINKNTPDMLFEFGHFVFEHGNPEDVTLVFNELASLKLTPSQKVQLATKEVSTYRNLKKYSLLHNRLQALKIGPSEKNQISKEDLEKLTSEILLYNGFLQELLQKNNETQQKQLLSYIENNLSVLRSLDDKNYLQYYFYEGEAHFLVKDYPQATSKYMTGLKRARLELKEKRLKETAFLSKSFDSLFKSLELQGDNPKQAKMAFSYYLAFFPKSNKSPVIHQRLVKMSLQEKKPFSALAYIGAYSKSFPSDLAIQQDLYKAIINDFTTREDIKGLKFIYSQVSKNFLSLKAPLLEPLSKNLIEIQLRKISTEGIKDTPNQNLEKYYQLYAENKDNYDYRVRILFQILLFEDKHQLYPEMKKDLVHTFSTLIPADRIKHSTNLNYFLNQVCLNSLANDCLQTSLAFEKVNFELSPENKALNFRILVAKKNYSLALKKAQTQKERDYILGSLILSYPNGDHDIFKTLPYSKELLKNIYELKFWRLYFSTLSIQESETFAERIKNDEIKTTLLSYTKNFKKAQQDLKLELPLPPAPKEGEVTFEDFSKFLEQFAGKFQTEFVYLEKGIPSVSPNFLPLLFNQMIALIEVEKVKYDSYIPKTSDEDLKKAIMGEVSKLTKLLNEKKALYGKLKIEALNKATTMVGSEFYTDKARTPITHKVSEAISWKDI